MAASRSAADAAGPAKRRKKAESLNGTAAADDGNGDADDGQAEADDGQAQATDDKAEHLETGVRHAKKQRSEWAQMGRRPGATTKEERHLQTQAANCTYKANTTRMTVTKETYAALLQFITQCTKAKSISEGIDEAIKLYRTNQASKTDATALTSTLRPSQLSATSESGLPTEPNVSRKVPEWSTKQKALARLLQSEANVSEQKMPVLLAITEMLWTGKWDIADIPTTRQLSEWAMCFDSLDRQAFAEELDTISAVHLLVDGSKSHADKRYALLCAHWNATTAKPAVRTLAAFTPAQDTAKCFADDIVGVLQRCDIFAGQVKSVMGDFAGTNWGQWKGLAVTLSKELDVELVQYGCDLHLQNRAMQRAVENAFGPYVLGDNHVIALAFGIPHLLAGDWPLYKPLLQKELDKVIDPDRVPLTKCPCAVVTRWWTVVESASWLSQYAEPLCQMAAYIYDFFPGRQSELRKKWKDYQVKLSNKYLRAQLLILSLFGEIHYTLEMAWSEEVIPAYGMAGFKAHLLPQRLVERCGALQNILDTLDDVFCEALVTCNSGDQVRLRAEIAAFLEEYLLATRQLGKMWWEAPAVFVALGDPGQGRMIAQCMLAAHRDRPLPVVCSLTQEITHKSVTDHILLTDSSHRSALTCFANGSTLQSDACAILLKWVQANAWSCPHINMFSESTFNLMDQIRDVGGPAMSPQTAERRLILLRNQVLAKRSHSPRKRSKKAKTWHWTKPHLQSVLDKMVAQADQYPECLSPALQDAIENVHPSPDFLGTVEEEASHARPSKRKKRDVVREAKDLVIPKKGRMYKEEPVASQSESSPQA